MKKLVLIIMALFALTTVAPVATAHASMTGYDYGNSIIRDASTTKRVKLFKVRVGENESTNKFHYIGDLKVGSKIRTSAWIPKMGGYVVTTSKHKCSKHHFYFVSISQTKHWFR